ncbi:MAG: LLM class flavin-dependent oxidoreductase [Rhodospirillales bacterium]|jgi:alkanesulfonate monooxygenase|nr:LLM class flavin-dependent oxidoreductase [Rhodospirillales bacterium]MBT4039360.1 LLM class flavin-dependent oxidoreductase [Rhodospirillales bacterium]MBT4626238.1 LLM class flavin-dependent oxidoreductase [Rhodospirillales bacterium]MBT5353093.1 LLM class flavin-dependent oxidoreductase [Rhodospirillales bacterium]MBT5520780.1 LLM class flavin-dependent oxidoreductase [Rhodospirillales bacterium]
MVKISDVSVMMFPWGVETPKVSEIVEAAQLAEELGFYSVTLPMHMTMPPGWLFTTFPNQDVLDAMVVLPAIAAGTKTLRLGTNSALLPLLPPYEWAKYFSTLDVMSEGRVIIGAAMGWWHEDFGSVGVNSKKRGKLFDEQLEILTRLWTEDRITFEGEHYQIDDIPMQPRPVQAKPPIWIGGGVKSIDRAAKYGECIVPFWPSPDDVRDLWKPKLMEAAARFGTTPKLSSFTFAYIADSDEDLEKYMPVLRNCVAFEDPSIEPSNVTISGSPEQCAEKIMALSDAGIDHFVVEFQFHGLESVAFGMNQLEKFATKVAPLLTD